MITTVDPVAAARTAALFVSDLSATAHPTRPEATDVIRVSLRAHGGSRGCAADVAAAYGDYPELAVRRMRWARTLVAELYQRQSPPHPSLRSPVGGQHGITTPSQGRLAAAA